MRNILAVTFALAMFAGVACQATNPSQTTSSPAVAAANSSSAQTALLPNEGSPIPTCQPGHCPPPGMQPQLIANEGSPIPTCQPGHCPPPGMQPQLIANEGSPIPTCQPGHCPPPGMQPQLIANEGSSGLALSTNWVTL
jgi:hypothetical protein